MTMLLSGQLLLLTKADVAYYPENQDA